MIKRFREVDDGIYRGSAPSIEDVIFLNKKLGINKIVSLDKDAGQHIERACKLLNINHIMLPIDINKKSTLIKFLKQDIVALMDKGGPTFIHCIEGKDRTSLACALYRCLHDGWTCEEALKEALKLGFGVGVNKKIIHLYRDIIQTACECSNKSKHKHIDHNNSDDINYGYDIVSNQREYPSDYRDYTLDSWEQQSWSPYEDYRVKNWPHATSQYIDWEDQYPNRNNYQLDDREKTNDIGYYDIPMSGQWDSSTQGINGAGPSLVGTGFV